MRNGVRSIRTDARDSLGRASARTRRLTFFVCAPSRHSSAFGIAELIGLSSQKVAHRFRLQIRPAAGSFLFSR